MKTLLLALFFVLTGTAAHAEAIPPELLDQEYQNCIKQPSNGMEAQKKAYCMCVRNKMTTWTTDTYTRIAQEVATNGTGSPTLEAMTRDCFKQSVK